MEGMYEAKKLPKRETGRIAGANGPPSELHVFRVSPIFRDISLFGADGNPLVIGASSQSDRVYHGVCYRRCFALEAGRSDTYAVTNSRG